MWESVWNLLTFNEPLSLGSLLACSFRASCIVCICWEHADNMRSSRRLNSSKQPHAPTWHNPTKIRPIAYNSTTGGRLDSMARNDSNTPSNIIRYLIHSKAYNFQGSLRNLIIKFRDFSIIICTVLRDSGKANTEDHRAYSSHNVKRK